MTANAKKYQIDMTEGAILPKIFLFTIPLICSNILQLLFNAADVIVCGRFAGKESLAAVGSTGPIINLLTNLVVGISIGANVIAAKNFGAKNHKELSQTVHTSILISLICGVALTFIGILLAEPLLILTGSPQDVLPHATTYLRFYFLGITSTVLFNFGSSLLRATGDTRRSLFYLFGAGFVNVLFNLLFVIVFKWGVAGVAIATSISQTIAATCVLITLIKEKGPIHLNLKNLHIHQPILIQIFKTGLPAGIQGMLFSISNVVIQWGVNSFDNTNIVAGNSASQNLEGFVWMAMNSYSQTSLCITSQNYGASNASRIKKGTILSELCVIFTGLILGLSAAFFAKPLVSIYQENPDVVAAGVQRLQIITASYFLCGMMDTMVGALRGIGYSILPMIVSLIGVCGLRILLIATIFQIPEYHNCLILYFSYPISWLLTVIAHIFCFIICYNKIKPTLFKVQSSFAI
ncbi:MAG: MATE family efflux transporter [Treponema sp.]|nr:MATE family efflux transporter [Treponema sp.]